MHLLVDLENLQPAADEVSAFIGSGGRAWVFHGRTSTSCYRRSRRWASR